MAKGHVNKTKKSKTTPISRKPVKVKSSNQGADKHALSCQTKCIDCVCTIEDDTKALCCEKCGVSWKCSSCLGIRTGTYDDLISEAGKELHWFCEPCYAAVINPVNDDMVTQLFQKFSQQLAQIEEKLDAKVDSTKNTLEKMVQELETKINSGYEGVVKSLEKSGTEVTKALERSQLDVSTVQGYVEGVMKVQSREKKVKRKTETEERVTLLSMAYKNQLQTWQMTVEMKILTWLRNCCIN